MLFNVALMVSVLALTALMAVFGVAYYYRGTTWGIETLAFFAGRGIPDFQDRLYKAALLGLALATIGWLLGFYVFATMLAVYSGSILKLSETAAWVCEKYETRLRLLGL